MLKDYDFKTFRNPNRPIGILVLWLDGGGDTASGGGVRGRNLTGLCKMKK
jgi:hypothetical protein